MCDVKRVTSVLLISEDEPEEEEEEVEQQQQQQQQNSLPTAKVGAKKQKKLEEKQAKKAQREVRGPHCSLIVSWLRVCSHIGKVTKWSSLFFSSVSVSSGYQHPTDSYWCFKTPKTGGVGGERGEEEDAGAQRAGETSGGWERATPGTETGHTLHSHLLAAGSSLCVHTSRCWDYVLVFIQEEDERRAKEEQDRREEEEYLKLKASFVVEDQGEEEQLTEDQVRLLMSSHHYNIPVSLSHAF